MAATDLRCPLSSPLHGKSSLPHKVLKSRFKRCLEASRRGMGSQVIDQGSDIRYHVSVGGLPYFTKGRYITTNNLLHPAVRPAFDRAVSMIEECLDTHRVILDECEITIVLRCVSLRRLKFRYYMVDHERKRIRWIHGEPIEVKDQSSKHILNASYRTPGEALVQTEPVVPTDKWLGYWEHMASFPTHRSCSPQDYNNALGHLSAMRAGILDSSLMQLDDTTIEFLDDVLRRFHPSVMNEHTTVSVAKTFRKIYERTMVEHRTRLVPRKAVGAMKSLYGAFSVFTGWTHDRDHKENAEEYHPSNHNTPNTSPRTSALNFNRSGQFASDTSQQSDLRHRTGRQAVGGT